MLPRRAEVEWSGFRRPGNSHQHHVGFLETFDMLPVVMQHGGVQGIDARARRKTERSGILRARKAEIPLN